MRTNIVPDDDLVQQGFALTGIRTSGRWCISR